MAKELKIKCLEKDDKLQDSCLSVFHAVTITFSGTTATKSLKITVDKRS